MIISLTTLYFRTQLDSWEYQWTTDFSQLECYLDEALKQSGWLILVGHEINQNGKSGTTKTSMLKDLIEYANDSDIRIWVAPVKEVANHVIIQRLKETQ